MDKRAIGGAIVKLVAWSLVLLILVGLFALMLLGNTIDFINIGNISFFSSYVYDDPETYNVGDMEYDDMVYRICFMMIKEQSSAEDATQNVFIKFIKASKEYESENHLKASLIVIAKNECKNHLKHWWNSKRDSFDDITEPSYNDNHKFSDVKDAINRLPDKYKIPVYLFYYEGYTTEEISKMLKINHSTIRSHLLEARKRLKIILEENNNE